MPEYIVVSRAQSGLRFAKVDPLVLQGFPSVFGRIDAIIQTRLAPCDGFSSPVPMGLMSEVRGSAPTLDDAVQEFSRVVQSVCPTLALIGNTPIEDMTPEIGYDITPGVTERAFFQNFLPEERLLIAERRRLAADLVVRVLRAIDQHRDGRRLRRAAAQYYQALRNWEPGQEILAVAHLWMGVEALTPVILRRLCLAHGTTEEGLAELWGIGPAIDCPRCSTREIRNAVGGEVRRREIFRGDRESCRRARKASDAFEHGFLDFPEIREHADAVRTRTADYLRRAILAELSLDDADVATLVTAPFSRPGHLSVAKYLRGKLTSNTDDLVS